MVDVARIIEAELDADGNLSKLVIEQEDHTIHRLTLPSSAGVGDQIGLSSYSATAPPLNLAYGTPIPFGGPLDDVPTIGDSLSWDIADPTKIVCEKAGSFTIYAATQATFSALAVGISCQVMAKTSGGVDKAGLYWFQSRGYKFNGQGADANIVIPNVAMDVGDYFQVTGGAWDAAGDHVADTAYYAYARVVRVD